jgi:hypothetical protein
MTQLDITQKQAEALHERLAPVSRYLYTLIQRMGQLGFEENDPLWRDVCAASYAMSTLNGRILCLCNPGKMGIANGQEMSPTKSVQPSEQGESNGHQHCGD